MQAFANMPLAKASHMGKPNIKGAGKYTLPFVEGIAKSQEVDSAKSKAVYIGKGEEFRTVKKLSTYTFLNIFSTKIFSA